MNFLEALGGYVMGRARRLTNLAAVIAAVLFVGLPPAQWTRVARNVLARQILFTGIDAIAFISFVAFLVGISVVVQADLWLRKLGQTQYLGPILVTVVIRELGPLLANFVVLGRSGNAVAAELAYMKINGEVHVLDALGLDPFVYLVLPRMLGFAISVFCLTVIFFVVSLASGYILSIFIGGQRALPLAEFLRNIGDSMHRSDLALVPIKTIIPALLSGAICCTEGLSVSNAITDVPIATTRSLQRSAFAMFFVSAAASFLSYL